MKNKFENVSVEKDTKILVTLNPKFGKYDTQYEKWYWDGLYGETLIFFNEDIKDTDEETLKAEIFESTMAKADSEITVKRTDLYTYFNFNFTDGGKS